MKINDDGRAVYAFLKENLRTGYKLQQVASGVGFPNSANGRLRTLRAIGEARELAEVDGLFIPDAVPAEGFVYRCTDHGVDVHTPAVHAHRRAYGSQRRAERHDLFAAANTAGMSNPQKLELKARLARAEARKKDDEANNLQLVAAVERDREIRKLQAQLAAANGQKGNGTQ